MQPVNSCCRSLLHRLPASTKLMVILLLVIGVALGPRRPDAVYFVPFGLLLVAWAISRMPLLPTLKRLLLAEFFILGIAVLSVFQPATRPLFFGTLIKSNLSVLALLILVWTTPFHDLLQQLRRARLPEVMLSTLALMYRYIPVLASESRRMQRARASRTFRPGRGRAWRSLAAIAGQLFIRSADRAERIYLAMCSRGWQ